MLQFYLVIKFQRDKIMEYPIDWANYHRIFYKESKYS